jgi:DNA primase
MIIWGRVFNIELWDLLKDIKKESESKTGFDPFPIMQNSGDDIFVTCPALERHGGKQEHTPSCSIHKESGAVHCFGCDYSDSIPGTIAKILDLKGANPKVAGYRWILKKYTIPVAGKRPLMKLDTARVDKRPLFLDEGVLDLYNYDHPYMYKRGLTEDVIDWFDLGFDKETQSITIPMRDAFGHLLFIKKRPIHKSKFHKYHIDHGVDKKDLLFGLNLIRPNIHRVKRIYLSEGEFDAMSYYCVEEYAAGAQGDQLFEEQVRALVKVARGIPIVLSYDNDGAGRAATERAIPLLRPYFPLSRVIYPSGVDSEGKPKYKDPNDLLRKGLLKNLPLVPIM